jgi:hypothetical protein
MLLEFNMVLELLFNYFDFLAPLAHRRVHLALGQRVLQKPDYQFCSTLIVNMVMLGGSFVGALIAELILNSSYQVY